MKPFSNTVGRIIPIANMLFTKEGIYSFDIYVDGRYITGVPIQVAKRKG